MEHIARHGITPEECEEAYRNGPMVRLCLGETGRGRLLTFVVMQRRIYRGEDE